MYLKVFSYLSTVDLHMYAICVNGLLLTLSVVDVGLDELLQLLGCGGSREDEALTYGQLRV